VPNIGPILYNVFYQYRSNIYGQHRPNIDQQYWPILSLCSAANIGAILCPILGQYCTTSFTNIGPILMANIGPILVNNIGQYCRCVALPTLRQYCAQYCPNIVHNTAPTLAQYCLPAGQCQSILVGQYLHHCLITSLTDSARLNMDIHGLVSPPWFNDLGNCS